MLFKNVLFFAAGSALELNGKAPIMISGPRQRTFRQLQDFAAEIFNADPDVSTVYTGDSWTKEFMEYGCYCNKAMRGGGKPDPLNPDVHENLCLELYACYKCINIDYDHSVTADGTYAAVKMQYSAEITGDNRLSCLDKLADGHSLRHEGHHDEETTSGDDIDPRNCPRHVCECDKHFVHTLLKHHKKCLAGEARFCLNDKYRYDNGWVPEQDCQDIGMNQLEHDKCCGTYPIRKAYSSDRLMCCDGRLTANTVC